MSAIIHSTTVTADGLARLLQQFKDKPRLAALLSSWLDEFQANEDAAFTLYYNRLLQNGVATGDILTKIGKLVGQGSEGLSDASFILLIKARIKTNRSTGRREDLIGIASLLVPGDIVRVTAYPPKSVAVQPDAACTLPPAIVGIKFLAKAGGAGTRVMFVWSSVARANTLVWGSVNGSVAVPTATQVPGSVNGSVANGGKTASCIQINGGP